MATVATVPENEIRVNLDRTPLTSHRKGWDLYMQAASLSGATAPVPIASATWAADLTVVTVFDGTNDTAYYAGEAGVGEDFFDYYKNTFVPPTSYGNPDPVNGTMYEIYACRIPGAAAIAGLCAANQ